MAVQVEAAVEGPVDSLLNRSKVDRRRRKRVEGKSARSGPGEPRVDGSPVRAAVRRPEDARVRADRIDGRRIRQIEHDGVEDRGRQSGNACPARRRVEADEEAGRRPGVHGFRIGGVHGENADRCVRQACRRGRPRRRPVRGLEDPRPVCPGIQRRRRRGIDRKRQDRVDPLRPDGSPERPGLGGKLRHFPEDPERSEQERANEERRSHG